MTNIDLILYINLDKRPDRRSQIEEELFKKMSFPREKVVRVPAIGHEENKAVGCTLSHIKALKTAEQILTTIGGRNVLILEDDFVFIDDKDKVEKSLANLLLSSGEEYDVVLLSYVVKKRRSYNDLLSICLEASKADSYLVRREYIPKVIECFEESVEHLSRTGMHWLYAQDVYWKNLMEKDRWFYFNDALGHQRRGYSDLAERIVENVSLVLDNN